MITGFNLTLFRAGRTFTLNGHIHHDPHDFLSSFVQHLLVGSPWEVLPRYTGTRRSFLGNALAYARTSQN